MTATLQGVEIDGQHYDTYADVASADIYLAADPNGTTWAGLDDDQKGRYLVQATRVLNAQRWKGQRVDPDQPLAWPRSGISGVDDEGVPQAIFDASIELANLGALGTDIVNFTSTFSVQKRLKAGSVEIENFRSFDTVYPLPQAVWRLIAPYIGGTDDGTNGGVRGFGTCGRSITHDDLHHSTGF